MNRWLIDTVGKSGTFILNIPGKPHGTIDSKEIAVLDGITAWMQVNSETIFETRPWKIYGEGPDSVKAGSFQGAGINKLGALDIRFTRNKANTVIYDIALGRHSEPILVNALGISVPTNPGRIAPVGLIGADERANWRQKPNGLRVELPKHSSPTVNYAYAAALKVTFA